MTLWAAGTKSRPRAGAVAWPADASGDSGQESPDALAGQGTAPARGRIFVPAAHRVIHYQEES